MWTFADWITRKSQVLKSLIVAPLLPDMDQLTQIMKVTGVPGPEFIQKLDSLEVGLIVINIFVFSLSNYSLTVISLRISKNKADAKYDFSLRAENAASL